MSPQLADEMQALNLSSGELLGHTIPKPLAPNESRLSASDEVLKRSGLPPRPDKVNFPNEYAAWEHTVSRALEFVTPTFTPLYLLQIPPPSKEAYSGATNVPVTNDDVKNYKITQVTGSWLVARPSPQTWAFKECGWIPAEFLADSWIGIDDKHFQAGLAQNCTTSAHNGTTYTVYPWYQFVRDGTTHRYRIHGLVVQPGDLVRVYLRRDTRSEKSVVSFFNESSATYSSFFIDNVQFDGNQAFWIVEDPRPKRENPKLSYLGATNFFDCSTNQVGTDKMGQPAYAGGNLYGATLLNIAEGGATSTARVRNAIDYPRDDDILTITSQVREYRAKN